MSDCVGGISFFTLASHTKQQYEMDKETQEDATFMEVLKHQTQFSENLLRLLKVCVQQEDLAKGCILHAIFLKCGLPSRRISIANSLINLYAKSGRVARAQQVFDELLIRDVISWTALISGFANHGFSGEALRCFDIMKHHGPPPNAVTFCCMLKICGNTKDLRRGEEVHSEIITNGLLIQSFTLGGALVDMYVKCGALLQAKCVFENLPSHNVVSWTALITGFCEHKHGEEALECLQQMKHEGLSPNAVTFACILKVCGSLAALDKGMELHANIIKTGFLETDYVLGNTLLDMYCKCGYLEKAQQIFDELAFWDVVTWNMLITGYIRLGYDEKALICFADMKNEGFAPNTVTFSLILKACASIGAPELGRELHSEIDRKGLLNHGNGLVNALIDMYAKCGIFTKARQVFDKLLDRDAVSWNTLIAGYCHQSQGEEALDCFEIMQQEGVSPDSVTFLCALKACGITGATIKGIETHVEVVRRGNIPLDNSLENAVVDMYTKCGLLTNAREVFNNLAVRNSITWTSMIAGYCDHGYYEQALMYFEQMGCAGVSPDVVTLTCVLKACSRIMGASKAWTCYESLRKSCGIVPTIEHCTCIVQLFCLAGHYDKMIDVVNESPSSHMMASCFSLLSACRKQENAQLASFAFDYARSWVFKDPN